MVRLWPIIEQLCIALQPRVIVEIGTGGGETTTLLAEFCQRSNATLHTIDPEPQTNVTALQETFPSSLIVHRDTSLNVLSSLPPFDCVLIDGDHNWYTVHRELEIIAEHCTKHGRTPLVLLHDVGWPYARRDQYYNIDRIPAEYRHSISTKGIDPASDTLRDGGINEGMTHAAKSGGPRNGVLAAVEDFLAQHSDWRLQMIQGFHGLGILAPQSLFERIPPSLFDINLTAKEHIAALEQRYFVQYETSASLRAELNHMRQTRSWRFTAPLRQIEAWFRNH
jgi:predicted O-methyltransferase YrrM